MTQDHIPSHGSIKQLDARLWQVTGSLPHGKLPRNMAIYQLEDKSLLLHSVVRMQEKFMQALEQIGQPKVMIVPNRFHRLDAAWYKERYPDIKVICPASVLTAVNKKVTVDDSCESYLPSIDIKYHNPPGSKGFEYVYELRLSHGWALVLADMMFNLPHLPGFGGWLMKVLGSSGFFGVTRLGKFFLLKEKKAFRDWLIELSQRNDIQVISVAHGDPITENCADALRLAASKL